MLFIEVLIQRAPLEAFDKNDNCNNLFALIIQRSRTVVPTTHTEHLPNHFCSFTIPVQYNFILVHRSRALSAGNPIFPFLAATLKMQLHKDQPFP